MAENSRVNIDDPVIKIAKLEEENRKLKNDLWTIMADYEDAKQTANGLRRTIKELIPYKNVYDELKNMAINLWDPMIGVAKLLQQRNPQAYNKLLAEYATAQSKKPGQKATTMPAVL